MYKYYEKHINEVVDPIEKAYRYMEIGKMYYRQRDYDKAMPNFDKAKVIRLRVGDPELIMNSYQIIGTMLMSIKHYDQAIATLTEGLQYSVMPEFSRSETAIHLVLLGLYIELGSYEKASESAEIAVKAYRDTGEWDHEAAALFLQAIALYELGNKEAAESALKRSYDLYDIRTEIYESEEYRRMADIRIEYADKLGIDHSTWGE